MSIAPQVGAAIINGVSSIAGAGFSAAASGNLNSRNRKFQHQENQLARDWQSWENKNNRDWQAGESKIARDWEEQMYLQYNTPSAMMQQYKDAGVNPYLSQVSQLGQGMGTAAPMSGSPASGTPPMNASPSSAMPDFSSLNDLGSKVMQAFGIQSQIANQDANTKNQLWNTAYQIYKDFGVDAYKAFAKDNNLYEGSPVNSLYSQLIAGQVLKDSSQTYLNNVTAQIKSNVDVRMADAKINELNQSIDKMKTEIDVLKTQGKLNEAHAVTLASEVGRNLAQSGLFNAMAGQINSLLPYLEIQACMSAGVSAMQYLSQHAEFSSLESYRNWLESTTGKKSRHASKMMEGENNFVFKFMEELMKFIPKDAFVKSKGYSLESGSSGAGMRWDFNSRSWYEP